MNVSYDLAEDLGGEEALRSKVQSFSQALSQFASTEGEPAPTAHPLVERIVREYNGNFTVEPKPVDPEEQ